MASQNSALGQESLIRARALVRPGVVITYVSTSQLLAGTDNSQVWEQEAKRSLWLRVVRLINLARCCSRVKKWQGERDTPAKSSRLRKTRVTFLPSLVRHTIETSC